MLPGSLPGGVETEVQGGGALWPGREKLSVCHVVSGDLWAGAESQLAALLGILAQREDLRLSAILLNQGRLADQIGQYGIEVKVISETDKGFYRILQEAALYLRCRDVRILHSHRYKENMLAALLAWRCRIPIVVRTQHGLPEHSQGLRRCKQGLLQWADGLVARWATDCVICVSADVRTQMEQWSNPGKAVTIHNGIDAESVRSRLDRREAKARLGVPEEIYLIGTAGRLEPIKRLDLFLAMAGGISTRLPQVRFIVVGEGSEKGRLRQLAAKNGLQESVLFPGHREDIYDVLRAMDIFVSCSDHEGLPMILLEALFLGVPVVARPVGGIPEVLETGINGVLVNDDRPEAFAEACLRLLANADLRGRLARAGTETVRQKFLAVHTAAEVARLYFSLSGAQ